MCPKDLACMLSQFSEGTELTSRANGYVFRRTEDQDWYCESNGEVYSDIELAEEYGEDLE